MDKNILGVISDLLNNNKIIIQAPEHFEKGEDLTPLQVFAVMTKIENMLVEAKDLLRKMPKELNIDKSSSYNCQYVITCLFNDIHMLKVLKNNCFKLGGQCSFCENLNTTCNGKKHGEYCYDFWNSTKIL